MKNRRNLTTLSNLVEHGEIKTVEELSWNFSLLLANFSMTFLEGSEVRFNSNSSTYVYSIIECSAWV